MEQIKNWKKIVECVYYIHIHICVSQIIHIDLAARNILLTASTTAKVADFGHAKNLMESDYYRDHMHVVSTLAYYSCMVYLFIRPYYRNSIRFGLLLSFWTATVNLL